MRFNLNTLQISTSSLNDREIASKLLVTGWIKEAIEALNFDKDSIPKDIINLFYKYYFELNYLKQYFQVNLKVTI